MKREVAERLRSVFTAPTEDEALRLLELFLSDYKKSATQLVSWAEKAVPEGLEVMTLLLEHRRRLRTEGLALISSTARATRELIVIN